MSSNRTVDSTSEAPFGMGSLGRLVQGLVRRPHYRLVRRLYHRHETLAPLLLFFGGVTWDALTLQRVGALLDNVVLGGYLLLLGGAIGLPLLDRHDRPLSPSLRSNRPHSEACHSATASESRQAAAWVGFPQPS